jgi:hypothetical protein
MSSTKCLNEFIVLEEHGLSRKKLQEELKDIECEGVDWINLAQDRDQ